MRIAGPSRDPAAREPAARPMGIYDREYVRVGPRSSSGLGSLRFISFNSWLIILNVVVFVLNILTSGVLVPVVLNETLNRAVDRDRLGTDGILRDQLGQEIRPRLPLMARGPQGQAIPDPQGR